MKTPKEIEKFREAFKTFILIKTSYRIDRGELDECIKEFCNGDNLTIDFSIDLIANDILFMKTLAGTKINKKTLDKVRKIWDKENVHKKRKWF